jgi:hypothetical protein
MFRIPQSHYTILAGGILVRQYELACWNRTQIHSRNQHRSGVRSLVKSSKTCPEIIPELRA